jgi:hypothetical protein
MYCIYLGVSSLRITINHVEQAYEEPPELTPVEEANPDQD